MSEHEFQRLMTKIDAGSDPTQGGQTRQLAALVIGVAVLLIVIPVGMKLAFDPASALADIAFGTTPFAGLGRTP